MHSSCTSTNSSYEDRTMLHSLTIIIPTYNRADQVRDTINSIKVASIPTDLDLKVILVDNNSTSVDSDKYVILVKLASQHINIQYAMERQQGRSHACNLGLSLSKSEWVGYIDDDETLDDKWLATAAHWIRVNEYGYVGGPCLPKWQKEPPAWLPAHIGAYKGILGWIEDSAKRTDYAQLDAQLCGGNFIARRALLVGIGGFNTKLGRGAGNLLGGEDGELHRRIKKTGSTGVYDPEMPIHHLIPQSRMTFKYHLRWAYWSGVSNRIRIENQPETKENCAHLLGIPRYRYSKFILGFGRFVTTLIQLKILKDPRGIIGLMDCMYLLGMIRGKKEEAHINSSRPSAI